VIVIDSRGVDLNFVGTRSAVAEAPRLSCGACVFSGEKVRWSRLQSMLLRSIATSSEELLSGEDFKSPVKKLLLNYSQSPAMKYWIIGGDGRCASGREGRTDLKCFLNNLGRKGLIRGPLERL
jgi:hypothetical protein